MDQIDHLAMAPPTPLTARLRSVSAPVPTDGIGLALRCAYLPRASDLPQDIADLLDVLDR